MHGLSREVTLSLIGTLHTPHQTVENMPVQPAGAGQTEGVAELFPEYEAGLKDLDGFSHVILLYHLHEVKEFKLSVKPFMDTVEHGIFATRAPRRSDFRLCLSKK
jgi:tRNA (Thr-GGU) A37 N-methylase